MDYAYEEVCRAAINKFGKEKQLDMAIEECSELTKAIVKYRRHNYPPVWRIKTLEEVADVIIMCKQLELMLAKDGEFESIFQSKIQNLENIILDDDPMRGLVNKNAQPKKN